MAETKQPTIKLHGVIKSTAQVGKDRNNDPIIQTVLVGPAPDPYSFPDTYCTMSQTYLGKEDQEVTVHARVVCRPWTDKNKVKRYPHQLWAA